MSAISENSRMIGCEVVDPFFLMTPQAVELSVTILSDVPSGTMSEVMAFLMAIISRRLTCRAACCGDQTPWM
jgi:hypothetical protein